MYILMVIFTLNNKKNFFFFLFYFTICLAARQTVLTENFLLQVSNISSRDGPSKSITKILYILSDPK